MACYPRIDRPCPLGIDEQLRLDGYCAHCATEVHALDAFDDSGRRAFMASRTGAVCVSYRLPVARAAMLGATMAAGLMAGAVMAQSVAPAPIESSGSAGSMDAASERLELVVMTGGVSKGADADWVDDSQVPELPVIVETTDAAATVLPLKDPLPRR